jgi:hypothetical protein
VKPSAISAADAPTGDPTDEQTGEPGQRAARRGGAVACHERATALEAGARRGGGHIGQRIARGGVLPLQCAVGRARAGIDRVEAGVAIRRRHDVATEGRGLIAAVGRVAIPGRDDVSAGAEVDGRPFGIGGRGRGVGTGGRRTDLHPDGELIVGGAALPGIGEPRLTLLHETERLQRLAGTCAVSTTGNRQTSPGGVACGQAEMRVGLAQPSGPKGPVSSRGVGAK